MNSGVVWQAIRPKDLLRLWQTPLYHIVPILKKKKSSIRDTAENSSESLLAGDNLPDTRRIDRGESDVKKGFLAVYVGPKLRRFVIPTSYLSLPDFRALMEKAADEFGFEQEGGLRFPCEEEYFEEILLRCLAKHQKMKKNKK